MLNKVTNSTLNQLYSILNQISPADYSRKLEVLNQSSIGQHVRHILEFYTCLMQGITVGNVNYDLRKRNPSIENDPAIAQLIIEDIFRFLNEEHVEEKQIIHSIIFNGTELSSISSISRELVYLIEHSIHHYALINIALKTELKSIIIPENFGIAYSTVENLKKNKELEINKK